MNKIFRTVWNHHRRQIVVVNENTTSHSQATGSSETSSVERFSSKAKALVVSALASAVCACFALPAQASWITDHGGSDNRLDWIVGTEGTTTWNTLQNQEFEILQGETLNVGSTGSNHVEFSKYTLPNVTAGNRITNRGTYNIHWVGNKAQAGAENEGNFLDNYGKVNIVFDQTPNFGPDVSQANGNANHNISAWEIYKWNMDGSDATWLKDKPAFYNREGAEFTIDVNVDATKLTADQDPLKRDKTITGFAIDGENDRAHMVAKNAGKMGISIENAGAKTYGVWVNYDNSFVNEKTGVLEIVTSFKKPASNFLNLDEYSLGLALGGSGSFQNDGTVKVDVEGSRTITAINGAGSSPLTAKFVNSAGATMIGNATTNVGGTALVVGLGANDLFENYGTLTGTALANGGVAQAIGINNPESMINNYAGATLDLTAKSVYSPESSQKARAEGIYLNDGEKFLNHGNATLTAIVDGAGTANVMNGWGINTTDASKAGTTVSNDGTMVINYTGALGGGIKADSSQLENANQLTINVNRTDAEVIRTDVKGIYVARGGSLLNTKDLDVVITANVDSKENFDKKFQASGGGASGIFATATDATPVFTNKGHANVQVTLKNNVDGLSSGVRGNGVYLEGNGSNSGTLDIHLDANYGTVTKDFDVFAASGFWLNGDAKRYGTPRFENTGSLNINTNFVADGIQLVEMTGPNSKGWSRGLEIHGQGTFVNNGQLKSVSTGNVITEGLGVQGGEFINNKDAEFVATSDGQYALGALISMPTASFEQVPPTVTNVNGATLTLTATAKNGTSSALYQSAGTTTNAGTLLLNSTGKNARGIVLSNYETSLDQNLVPVLNNTGTLTITANSLEDGQPSSLHEVHGILLHKGEVNNSGTITTNVTGDGLVEGLKVTQTTLNNQLGGVLNINSVSNKDVYQDGMAAGVSIGANGNVVNAGELNIDMESHAHFIKGIAFYDRTSQLTNTGSITITGTNHGDGTSVEAPSLSDTKNAYGIYMNKSEQFANDGTVEIAVNSLKGVSMGIGVHDAEFTNNEHGHLNITTKAYEKQAYGIDVYGASGRSNNAGTITFDVTGGTTTSSHATGLFVRNGGFYGNTGTLDFNLHGVTSVDSNAEVLAIDLTRENTKFKNQGRIDITGRRTGDIATSGDLLGIRVNNGAVFENTDTGTISIDLGATGNHKYGNNFAVSVFNASTFGNKGTINITLDQEANNIGTLHGLMLGADAIVNNAASALIKIDVAPEDVASGHVWAINGEGASIRNYGTIETNGAINVGSIVGSSVSLDGGTVKLTGKDAVSTVATELKTGTLENAGTLTVGSKTSPNWAVFVYDLKNTGTLNAGTLYATNSFDNSGVVNVDTTQRIALSTYGKEVASGEHVAIVNRESGQLTINVNADPALTAQHPHTAGIDLFGPTNQPTMTGGDFTNLGSTAITVEADRGFTYGIIADSTHESTIRNDKTLTIDVTKSASEAKYGTWGIRGNHATSIINNGTLSINGDSIGDGYLQGIALYGSDTKRGSFRNDGLATITLVGNKNLDPSTATNAGAIGLNLSFSDAVNTSEMVFNVDGHRSDAIKLQNGSSMVNSGNITVNTNPSEGMDLALAMIGGSHFTNAEGASFTFNYLSDDPALANASTDGIKLNDEGTVLDNSGTIAINLKHLGERDDAIWLKGLVVHTGATLNNAGTIEFSSETNKSASVIDGAMAVNGTFVNNGTVDLDVISHESDRQVWVGNGTLQNKNVLTMTALNDGTGDVVGFMHDWKSVLPEEKTLNITNERVMNLTLTAENGSAILYDMQGKERFENAVGATVNTTVSGGSAAKGWVMGDTSVLVNEGQVDLKLEGLKQNTVLAGVEALGEGVTATNNSTFSLTLAGTGASATGLKGNATGALFTNTGRLTVKNEGQFDQVAGIDWNGKFNNEGVITLDMTRAPGATGAVNGLLLGDASKFENKTNGTLKIDIASQDVAKSDVFAINGEGATIKNFGLIETNGAINVGTIYGDTTSTNGGILKLTGRDSVSTVTGQLSLGRIENAGTLTVGTVHALSGPTSGAALRAYDLINTGTLNADTAWFTNTFTNEGEVNISTTTNRIALSTLGKDKSTGEHVTILNKKDGVLNISTKPNESLTADSKHVAGIDLFSSGDLQTSVGGDFINLGTTNIDVESHKGHTYGIVADSSAGGKNSTIRNDGSLIIEVAKLSDDDTSSVRGIHTLSGVSIINNGTLTINASKQGNQRLYGVVSDGSETDRNTFHNTKDMTITLTENGLPSVDKIANEGLYGLHLSYTDAVNTGNLNLNLDGYRAEGIRVRDASTFLNQGAINVSIKPKDSALLGDVVKQGNNYALQVIEGSTFKNDVNGTITYRYENDNAQLTTAFTDGLTVGDVGSEIINLGSIDIHLKDLGERQASKWMKGILVGSLGTLTNEGNIQVTSETNRATESIDGVIAVNGQLVNRGDLIVNATSHESDRQFLVGSGHLQNQKNLTLTLINDGAGNVVGFYRDWTQRTPEQQTLHIQNEKDMNLTLKALNGTATIFDMLGQQRFDNAASGVVTASVSGGAGANGWSLADTSIFANDNEINLTLTGLSDSAKLAGLTMLGGEAVATNSGTMNITLAGQGAEAYGLKSTVADALFTNDGTLNIESTGTFTQASGMDWAGTVANAGEINSNVGLKIGTVTGTGSLNVTGGDVSVDQLNDQRQVILSNVGTANFGTIAMKSGSLEVNSKTTIANVTGNTSIKNLTNAGNLTLGGTLTLGANGAPGALNNTGTLTIKGHTTAVGSITNSGRFTAQDMDVQGSVYNRRTGVMQTGTLTVRGDKALTNEGEMTVADNSSVFGTLTNTGTIYLYDKSLVGEDGKIENRDELLVFGSLEVNGLLINLGTSKTQELILNGESISGTSGSFFMADRADVGAESIAQSGQVNGKRTNFGKDYWGTVTVNAVYENHDLIFAGSNDAILDQLGQGLSGTGMMIAAGGSILNQSGATLQINGALDNSGSVTGGTLALDASSQLTNRKTINVDALTGNDITFTQGETGATLTTAKNEVTNSNFILTQGNASFDTLGTGNTYQLGGHVGDSVTVDLGRLTSDSTVNIGQGAELAVTTIDLDGVKANTVVLDGGTLKTSLDQIFADVAVNGAVDIDAQSSKDTVNVSGMTVATNVGAIKDAVSTGIAFNSGTVAFTDRVFSLEVTNDVLAKLEADDGGNLEVAFNGKAAGVDAFTVDIANQITATKPNGGSTYAVFTGETLVNKDTTQPGLTHTQLVVGSVDPLGRYTPNKNAHHLTQSMGFKNVTGVTGGLYINDARFVLVGDAKQSIDLADGLVQVIGGEDGLVLGSYGSEVATKGHLAELNLGVFAEQGGYTVAGGATDVHNGDFVVDTLRLGGTLTVGDADRSDKGNAKLTIGSLTGYNGDVHNYGDTTITTIAVADNKSSMQIHNHGKLEIQNGTLEGRLENKVGAKVTTGDVILAYTESVNDGTWLADTLTIAGSKKYIGDMIGRGELLNAGTLTVNKDLTLGSTLLSDDVASGGVLTNRSTLKNRPAKLTVNGTLTMDGKSVFVNDGRYASVTANALTMAAGSSFTNQKGGTVSVTEHGQIAGQYKNDATSSFGSLTVTQTGAVTNTGTLSVTGQTELAGSITGTGNVTTGNLTVDATGVLAMTGTGALTAQDVVLNAGGKVSVAGDSQLNALTATNAGELAFGSLAMTGDLSLTGSVMTALLSNAGNVTLDRSTLTSNHDVTLGSLTMTGSEATLGNATIAGNIDLTGGQLTTGTLTGEALTLRDQASLTAGNTHIASLNATTGTLSLGTLTVDGDITLDGSTVTAQLISGGNASLTNGSTFNGTGSNATLNSLSLASGSTMTVDRLGVTNAVKVAGVGSAFTGALTQGGVTTVTDGGQITSTGGTNLESLTMKDAKDSTFGQLTVNGNVTLTGTNLKADLQSAGDVLINQGATIASTGSSHLGTLTMTNAGTSTMGDVTVDGAVSLTNTNLTANLVKGDATTLTGSTLISTGSSELASLTLDQNSNAQFGKLTVNGVLSVDGSILNAQIAHGGATTVSNGGQVQSTGSTTLDSLTMTDAEDSTFGTLTVKGDVTLAGTNLTADLLSANDVLIHQGATIASTGTSHLGSLTMTDAGTSSMGDVTVDGVVSLTNTNLTANLVKGGVTTLTGSQLTSTGTSELASLTLSGASSASFGTLNVAGALSVDGSVLNGQIANAGATEVTNGGQITATGVTTLDSLTMTDAKDSTFGTLTVNGDVALTGSKLTADLRQAGNVTLTNGTLLSTGKTTMADYSQTGGVGRFGTVTANNVNVVDGAFTTAGLVAQSAAFAGKTSQVALNGTTHLGSLTITGTDVSTDVLTVTDKLVNDSLLTGSSLTAKGADDALVTVNNTGTMRFDSASGKVTYTQSEGEFDITKNNFTGSTFDVTGGIVRTDTLGKGNAWTLGGLMDSSVSMNINTLTSDSTVSIKDGATLETSIIALNGKANTVVLEGGTLSTVIDQIFTDVRKDEGIDIEAGKPGDIVDVEGLNAVVGVGAIKDSVSAGIAFNSGTVAFNDKVYSLTLATDVLNKLEADDGGNLEVVFNGRANVNQFTVDLANSIKATNDGKPAHAVFAGETLINIDKTQPDLHHSKLVVGSADPSVSDAHHLTQSMGFMNVTGVQDGLFIRGEGTEFVLVGVDAKAQGVGDVHNFKLADGDVDVGTGSTLTLGSFGKALGTEGVLGLVTNEGTVNIKNGLFTLNELTGNGTLAVSDADHAKVAATLKVGTLTQHHVNNFGSIIAETMTVDTLANAGDVKATTLTLNGKGSTSSGKIEAKTATIADAASLTLTGSWVGDTLTVDGTLSMMDKAASMDVGSLTVNTNAQVTSAGTFNVDDLVVNGHLTQSGTATHKTVTVADLAELTNNGSLTTNTLTVEGTYAGSGALTVNTNTTVTGSLTSTGAKTNLGSLTMTDATLVAKDLTTSDATVSGQSSVTVDRWTAKDVMLEGVTTVNGAFSASELTTKGELTAGATTVTGAFVQTAGHATLSSLSSGTFESNGIVNVDKTFNTTTLTQKGGELTVGGALTATAVTLDGVATVKGGLTAESLTTSNSLTAGITTLTGAFVQTAGNATLGSLSSGTFESNGIVNVDKTLNTTTLNQKGGELHVSGTLTATNATFNGTVESGDIHAQSVTTSGSLSASDATIEGIFDQTDGTVTLEDLTAGSVNQTTGQMTASNVTADKITLGGKTDVAGLTAGQLSVSGTFEADVVTVTGKYDQSAGTADIGTLTSESFANAGDVTVDVIDTALNNTGDLTINKTFELSGTNDGTLTADRAKGTLTDFTNKGTAQFGSTTVTDLTNNGTINFADATLNGVNVNNKGMTSNTLTVAGSLTSTGTLTSQKTTVNGTLSVNGGQAQLGELGVKGTLTTKGELTAGKTNLTGTLNVAQGGVANLGATTVNKGHVNVAGGKLQVESLTQKGGSLSLTQGGSFDGKLNITGADITLGNASLNADGSIKDSNLTITGGTWGDDLTNLVSTDKGALGNNTLTMTGGTLDLGDNTLTSSGSITMTGGTLIADNIALDGKTEGVITVGGKGTLQTTLNQIFKDFVVEGVEISATNWEEAWGGVHGQVIDAATDVGDVKDSIITGIHFNGGSLTFTDEAFRTDLVAEVGSALAQTFGDGKVNVEFTGHAVDDFTLDTIHKLEQDGMADRTQGLVFAGDDLINNSGDTTLDVGKADSDDIHMNTGFAGVTNTDHINIKDDLEFVLVGKTDKDGKPLKDQLLSDAANGGSVHVENGTLTLGSNGMKDKTGGTLAEVVLDEQGNLVIKNGDFTVDRIESDGTLHVTGGGSLTSNEVTLDKGDNKIDEGGVLIVEEDEKGNGSLHIKGEGTLTNDGTLIAGGDNSHVDTTVDGTLTNNGTGVYDDMTINPDGHYHNTSTGKDKGDKIEVAEGGKWTNEGQSNWGQIDINGSFDNTGSIIIGDGKAETDDFHVGSNATVNQDGKLDASNAGHTIIEGNFTTGDLTEDGKPDPNAGTKFDDVTVTGGAHLENNGIEIGNNLTVDKDGEYVNNGQSQWGSVDMNGTLDNTGSIVIGDGKTETDDFHVGPDATVNQDGILDASNAGHTIIEGNFTTGDLTEDGKPDPNAGTKFDDVTVTGGAHLENNGTEIGNNLTVDKDGEYVNNGQSQWGTVDIAGKGENNGDLIIKGDGNDATGDLIIEGTGDLVNNGNLIVGGKDTNNDVIVDGTLTNNGTGVYDDMIINPDGHYNNTTTGKDQGDKIEVTEGGKWTNDGQSNWGQVDINGNASNNGDLIIGNGNDKDDDFHIGPNGSLDNQGHIDARNSGTAQIEGDLVNGTLSPDGKPDTDTSIKFDDVVVENGGKLENNGTESGDSLVVKPGGDYINNGNSNWNDVTIEDGANGSNNGKLDIENDFVVDGDFNNNGSINAGNTIIGGNFDQTDNGSLNTGDLTVRPGGNIDMDKGEINVSGDLNLNGANVVIGNWKALSQENRVSPTWSADKPIDGKIWVIGNGDLTFGTASEGFADKLQKFDKKVPGLSGAASRVTVGQTVTMGAGSSLAVGSNVWNPAKDQGRVELTEGSVYFGRDSYVLIDIGALGDGPAFTTTVEGATATVESGASLVFGNLSKTGEFTLLEGFEIEGNFDKDGNWTGGWDGEDMYIVNEDGSGLDYFITINVDKDKDRVNANVTVADIATVYPNIVLPGLGNEALKDCQSGKDSSFICSIVKNENLTVAEKTQIINSVAQIASVAGTTASAFTDMGMTTDVLESRLSFTGPTHKNGQLLQIPATDALWVEVIGGKSKTTSLNYTNLSGGYKSDTYGFMIGADALMPKPAVKLGGAFSYLSGSLKSVGGGLETSNSYDTYGAHLYAAWTPTTKFNLIGHMDWMHQESDVNMTIGQSGFNSASAKPKVNVAQVGVRAEVRETAGLFEIVPHVGVRGVYTKTENFKTKLDGKNAFGNELEDTFTVQLPIGLSVSGNIPANTGWTVSPKADVTFVGQVGDTEQKTVVSGTSMSASDTVTGAFAGECYGQFKLGLSVINPKADTSFGGTVGYTRGDAGKKDLSFGVQFTKNF